MTPSDIANMNASWIRARDAMERRLMTPSDIANMNASWIRARDAMDRFFSMATGKAECYAREIPVDPVVPEGRVAPSRPPWATGARLAILDLEYPRGMRPKDIYGLMQAEPGPKMPTQSTVIAYGCIQRGLRRREHDTPDVTPSEAIESQPVETDQSEVMLPADRYLAEAKARLQAKERAPEPAPVRRRVRGQAIRNLDLSRATPAGPPIIVALDVVRDWAAAQRIPFAGSNLAPVNQVRKQYGLPLFQVETFRGRT